MRSEQQRLDRLDGKLSHVRVRRLVVQRQERLGFTPSAEEVEELAQGTERILQAWAAIRTWGIEAAASWRLARLAGFANPQELQREMKPRRRSRGGRAGAAAD
jgi:hypothetical protein